MQYRLTTMLLILACASAVLSAACQKTRIPDSATKPAVPPLVSETPSFSPLDQRMIVPEESKLPFIVKTDLTPLQRAIRTAVPERIPDRTEPRAVADSPMEHPSGWTFVRQGDPQIKIQDGLVVTHATYLGEPQSAALPDACRANPVQVTVDSTGQVQFHQQGERILVQYVPSQVNVGQMGSAGPNPMPSCDIGGLAPRDVAERWFQAPAFKERLSQSTDTEWVALPVGQFWKDLSAPVTVPVSNMNSRLCLYWQPTELVFGKPQGTMDQTVIHGFSRHTPTASFETECRTQQRKPVAVNTGGAAITPSTAENPFRMLGSIPITYAAMNQSLQNKMFHQTIRPADSGDPAVIEKITASDAKGRVLVAVDMSGGLNGTIYYWGTPQLQNNGRVLRIPDLEMAQESRRALDTFRLGHWQVVDHHIKEQLREAAVVDLGPQLDAMKRALTGQHKAGNMTVDMLVARQQPQQVRTTEDGLVAYYLLDGTASATGQIPLERTTRRDEFSAPGRGETSGTIRPSDR